MKLKRLFTCITLILSIAFIPTVIIYAVPQYESIYGYAYANVEGRDGEYKISAGTVRKNGAQQASIFVDKVYYDGSEETYSSGTVNKDVLYTHDYEYIEDYTTKHRTYKDNNNVFDVTLYN